MFDEFSHNTSISRKKQQGLKWTATTTVYIVSNLHIMPFLSSKVHWTLAVFILCSCIKSLIQHDFHCKMVTLSSSGMQWCVSIVCCGIFQCLPPGFVVNQKL